MTPVKQTIIESGKGNCVAACVASLLGIPCDDVPNFVEGGDAWLRDMAGWLRRKGFVVLLWEPGGDAEPLFLGDVPYVIAGGSGPRFVDHACIYREGRLVHDPHPSGEGLTNLKWCVALVPIDPERKHVARQIRGMADEVERLVFAFDDGDSRRDDLRDLARRARQAGG